MTIRTDRLAIDGGVPVRDIVARPWPSWPEFDVTEEEALLKVLRSGIWWYVEGAEGRSLEQEFAEFQQARYAVACTNGSAALEIALRALDIGCGDEVIVPPYTFIATATAVLAVGATPVFADIQPGTLNLDPILAEAAITSRTRAIIAVHMAGRPADLDAFLDIGSRRGLAIIEDAAQAHAAAWRGRRVGAIGCLGTFSLQASKNLNAGEGGLITSDDEELADKAWSVMNVGRSRTGKWYEHNVLGSNFRMTEFQSAIARVQLSRVEQQTERRTASAIRLRELLSGVEGVALPELDSRITTHAYHLFTFRYSPEAFQGRTYESFLRALWAEGIPCSDGYVPLYREKVFQNVGATARCAARTGQSYGDLRLEVCEAACSDTVWLPQKLLLAPPSEMDCVAHAIARIQTAGV